MGKTDFRKIRKSPIPNRAHFLFTTFLVLIVTYMARRSDISSIVNLVAGFAVLCEWVLSEVSDQTSDIGDVMNMMTYLQKIQILGKS